MDFINGMFRNEITLTEKTLHIDKARIKTSRSYSYYTRKGKKHLSLDKEGYIALIMKKVC